jgi:hypothetical protein
MLARYYYELIVEGKEIVGGYSDSMEEIEGMDGLLSLLVERDEDGWFILFGDIGDLDDFDPFTR